MDMYRVDWARRAKKDLAGIRRYMSKQTTSLRARMFVKAIKITVDEKISFMPQKYRLLGDPLLAAMGYRRMYVKSYTVLFAIDEAEKIVNVERVIHSKRDLINVLRGNR
jgi:plasmid stabilization system protein ParE